MLVRKLNADKKMRESIKRERAASLRARVEQESKEYCEQQKEVKEKEKELKILRREKTMQELHQRQQIRVSAQLES